MPSCGSSQLTIFNYGGYVLQRGSAVWCDSATTIGPDCAISRGVRILDSDRHRLMRDGEPSPDTPVRIALRGRR